MDLVSTLRKKIESLAEGDYMPGLRAVLLHIETAAGHLTRGQNEAEDPAFTDAIYRTNQAFEGSVKEAYRVLSGETPDRKTPFEIERYLAGQNVLPARVLSYLTNYRTEWRNPSTHDYKLDFKESEAFLAIASISALACLLLDQIAERLSFNSAQAESKRQALSAALLAPPNAGLLDRIVDLVQQFCIRGLGQVNAAARASEAQFIGALHGFLASVAPELRVETDVKLNSQVSYRVDLLVTRGDDRAAIEITRSRGADHRAAASTQLLMYQTMLGVSTGVLVFMPEGASKMHREDSVTGEMTTVSLTPA